MEFMFKKKRGTGGVEQPVSDPSLIYEPWRNVAIVDEDSLLDMIRVHALERPRVGVCKTPLHTT